MSSTSRTGPRSRYSQPWAPKNDRVAASRVVVAQVLAAQAAEDDHRQRAEQRGGEQPWPRGSRPAISGARKIPAAR